MRELLAISAHVGTGENKTCCGWPSYRRGYLVAHNDRSWPRTVYQQGTATDPKRPFKSVLKNRVVDGQMQNLALGLRHYGANSNSNCDSRTNAKGKVADCDSNAASNRYSKTNSSAYESACFFVG